MVEKNSVTIPTAKCNTSDVAGGKIMDIAALNKIRLKASKAMVQGAGDIKADKHQNCWLHCHLQSFVNSVGQAWFEKFDMEKHGFNEFES